MTDVSAHELVSGWLAEMAPSVGMDLQLEQDGSCAVEFPENLVVVLAVGEDRYSLMSSLVEAPAEASPRTLEQALRLNLDYSRTRGGSLGFFEMQHELVYVYHRELDATDNAETFTNRFMNFISTAYDLRAELLAARDAELRAEVPGFSWDQPGADPEADSREADAEPGGSGFQGPDPHLTRV
jgi:hypothetical protein